MPDIPNTKRIRVEGDRVTFIANVRHGTVWASFLYLGVTLALFLPSLNDRLGYGIVIFQAMALPDLIATFLHNLANWSRRTVFDGAAAEARHANMLGAKEPLAFADVADFVRVRSGAGDGARFAYKVTRKGRRFGRGWELTRFLPERDAEFAFAEKRVLPALRLSIKEAARRAADGIETEPRHFKTDGTAFTRLTRRKSPVFAILIVVLLLVPFPTTTLGILVLVVAALVHALFGTTWISINPTERALYARSPMLAAKTAVAFDDILGIEQLHNISIFQPYSVCLRCRDGDGERSVPLCCSYFGKTAEAVAGETEALLAGSGLQAAPSNAVTPPPSTVSAP